MRTRECKLESKSQGEKYHVTATKWWQTKWLQQSDDKHKKIKHSPCKNILYHKASSYLVFSYFFKEGNLMYFIKTQILK